MKILAVSDRVVSELQGPELESRADGVDAIISCGDLPFAYLEYLATFVGAPLFYVLGNHDPAEGGGKFPKGCIPLDGTVERLGDFSLVGLSGCRWYSGGPNQYSERQMRRRSILPCLRLSLSSVTGTERPTMFVSHAAPFGMGDAGDLCHRGFETFVGLMKRYSPLMWLHGHVHLYGRSGSREEDSSFDDIESGNTRVVNAYGYRILTI